MSYIYDLVELDCYKTNNLASTDRKEVAENVARLPIATANRNAKVISGALPPNPPGHRLTAKEKRHRLDREKFVDKLLSAGQTLIEAKLKSLKKYPLLDFEKC